jgi:hypothetical protein
MKKSLFILVLSLLLISCKEKDNIVSVPQEPDYKEYVALVYQNGIKAPVPTILSNTFSDTLIWSRQSIGTYLVTSKHEFTIDKTIILISGGMGEGELIQSFWYDGTRIMIYTFSSNGTSEDNLLANASVMIRVYK